MLLGQWEWNPFPFRESEINLEAKSQQVVNFRTGMLQQYTVERDVAFYFPSTKELALQDGKKYEIYPALWMPSRFQRKDADLVAQETD